MTGTTDIKGLADAIRRIEKRDGCNVGGDEGVYVATGWDGVDGALFAQGRQGLDCRAIHEWFGAEVAGGPRGRPPLCIFQHLVRQACRAGANEGRRWAVWIGRDCWPYPWGLARADLLPHLLLIDPPDRSSRLWAIDLAARCGGIAAVVADGGGLNMAATRRLQLAAQAGRALVLLTRPLRDLQQLSAAATRWLVQPRPSTDDQPRWRVRLLRCKAAPRLAADGQGSGTHNTWHLRWNDATGTVHLAADVADRSAVSPAASRDSHTAARPQRSA